MRIINTASAVNYVQVTGAATGQQPSISAQGSDAGVILQLAAKGGSAISFVTNGVNSALQFQVLHTGSSVNYYQATGGAAGQPPRLISAGSDTNLDLTLTSKGSGNITTANSVIISNSSASTSTTTGALIVTGGAGVGGNLFVGGFANINISSGSADSALQIVGNVARGGAGYHDFLRVTSTAGGATNISKHFRLDSTGNLQIINSAYSSTLLTLTDAGHLSIGGNLTVNGQVNNPTITNYVESVVAIGTVTTASTISLTNGTVQTATLTASTACTFTMPTATAGKSFTLLLKQAAATGNGTATFTGVKFNGVGAPTITAAAGKMDILSFISDGTNWYGSYTQGYTP
jgi:hypothetical protein